MMRLFRRRSDSAPTLPEVAPASGRISGEALRYVLASLGHYYPEPPPAEDAEPERFTLSARGIEVIIEALHASDQQHLVGFALPPSPKAERR